MQLLIAVCVTGWGKRRGGNGPVLWVIRASSGFSTEVFPWAVTVCWNFNPFASAVHGVRVAFRVTRWHSFELLSLNMRPSPSWMMYPLNPVSGVREVLWFTQDPLSCKVKVGSVASKGQWWETWEDQRGSRMLTSMDTKHPSRRNPLKQAQRVFQIMPWVEWVLLFPIT